MRVEAGSQGRRATQAARRSGTGGRWQQGRHASVGKKSKRCGIHFTQAPANVSLHVSFLSHSVVEDGQRWKPIQNVNHAASSERELDCGTHISRQHIHLMTKA